MPDPNPAPPKPKTPRRSGAILADYWERRAKTLRDRETRKGLTNTIISIDELRAALDDLHLDGLDAGIETHLCSLRGWLCQRLAEINPSEERSDSQQEPKP